MARYTVHRVDTSQPAIVQALKAVGAKVLHVGDPFDFLVYHRGQLYMMDAKTQVGTQTPKKTKTQQQLLEAGWPVQFPTTPHEALRMIGVTIHG